MDVKACYPDKLGLNLRKIHPKGNIMMRHQEVPTLKPELFYKTLSKVMLYLHIKAINSNNNPNINVNLQQRI